MAQGVVFEKTRGREIRPGGFAPRDPDPIDLGTAIGPSDQIQYKRGDDQRLSDASETVGEKPDRSVTCQETVREISGQHEERLHREPCGGEGEDIEDEAAR